jgi:hypothetical protein
MTQFWMNVGWCIAGYVGCIFSWPKVKLWINGAETEAQALRDKASALIASIKSKV